MKIMKFSNYVKLVLFIFLVSVSNCYSQEYKSLIVGVWVIERYDNIDRRDIPPAGMLNTIYIFYKDGNLKHFRPGNEDNIVYGRGNTPYKELIPYRIENDKFWGWLGLVNDLYGERKINFQDDNEFTIEYVGNSIATFKRISTNPSKYPKQKLVNIPFTISGINYNKEFIQKTRNSLKNPSQKSKYTKTIIGKWQYIDKVENLRMTFTFKENNVFKRKIELIDSDFYPPEIISGDYHLQGNLLLSSTDPAPAEIQIKENTMTFTADGVQFVNFVRVEQ